MALVGGLGAVGLPAATASVSTVLRPTTWAYTDSRNANTSYVDTSGDAPVGAWRDAAGKLHRSRSYFSFDIAAYQGKRIVSALLVISETSANDCGKPRNWQLWATGNITSSTTWRKPPRELFKVATIGGIPCPAPYIETDLSELIRAAAEHGATRLTLELRVPERDEGNIHYGRRVRNNPALIVNANTAPDAPSQLTINSRSCDSSEPLFVPAATFGSDIITAKLSDPDTSPTTGSQSATPTFAVWPADQPTARVEWTSYDVYVPATVWGYLPSGTLQDGVTYVAAVRSFDGYDWSPWSAECRFTVDSTRPDRAPLVSSTDYGTALPPGSGGPGIAGNFVFSPAGVPDVAGYMYGIGGAYSFIAADSLGGPATAQVTPTRAGPQQLTVQSVDRAGQLSNPTTYRFWVRDTAPDIEDADVGAWAGDPHHLTFRPNMSGVVSYTYQIDDASPQTLTAAADGTAQLTVVPNIVGSSVYVFSTTASGQRSGQTWFFLSVDTSPYIESEQFPTDGTLGAPVGTTGTFTLRPHMHGVVSYTYQFNQYQVDEQPPVTVPAGPDGSATISFTPTRAFYNTLNVTSTTADGTQSQETGVAFYPASIAPTVSSTAYPAGQAGGGPGVTGSFTFGAVAADVVEYSYQFGNEPVRTVAAAADGSAVIEWTPQTWPNEFGGWTMLVVSSRSSNGLVSDPAYYNFQIDPLAPTVTSDIGQWPDPVAIGQTVTFTFTARLPASTAFVYTIDDGAEVTVAADPTGTAVVSWTPDQPYVHQLMVRSVTATTVASGPTFTSVWVNP
jgi:hypothetical protein